MIWRQTKLNWDKYVYKIAYFTVVASILGAFFPQTMHELGGRLRLDERLADKVKEEMPLPGEPTKPQTQQQGFEKFTLKAGEEIPTVMVGPGTRHRLWADKPYKAVSVQANGRREIYNMPAGYETWHGGSPSGRLRLVGVEDGTTVEISSQR